MWMGSPALYHRPSAWTLNSALPKISSGQRASSHALLTHPAGSHEAVGKKALALEYTFLLYLLTFEKREEKPLLISASCSHNAEEKLFGNGLPITV